MAWTPEIGVFVVGAGVIVMALLVLAFSDRRAAGPRNPYGKAESERKRGD